MKNLLLILFVAALAPAGIGQVIKGTVYDGREGVVLEGAIVIVAETEHKAVSDENGKFEFGVIPKGIYRLITTYVGYKNDTLNNVSIIHDSVATVRVEIGGPCKYDSSKRDSTCPRCNKTDKVIPITYGFHIGKVKKRKYYHAGCELTGCDPNWYCKRDKLKF